MSILTYGGRFGRIGGKITSRQSANLVFQVEGQAFLQWYYVPDDPYAEVTITRPNGYLFFQSNTPNSAIINYGDGVVEEYQFTLWSGSYYLAFSSQIDQPVNSTISNMAPLENHIFQDSFTGRRGVTINIKKPNNIIQIATFVCLFYDILPQQIANLKNIETLSFQFPKKLIAFPYEWSLLTNVKYLNLTEISETKFIVYPSGFSNFKLLNLSIFNTFDFSDIETSNLSLIANYADTLESLDIRNCNINDLPDEFSLLVNLKNLEIGSNGTNTYSSPPPVVNEITSLTRLFLGYFNPNLNDWGDLSGLINLETLFIQGCTNLPTNIPDWWLTTKLKEYNCRRTYDTQQRMDEFVDSLFVFVTTNAPMSGTASDPFRSMTIVTFSNSDAPIFWLIPTGTYQQPSGYVQGVSNGTPASQYEKVWVLVNQYDHVWNLPPL